DVDRDRRPDFVYTVNDGMARLFRGRRGAPGLVVRLRGGQGNPAAVGATVWLRAADGTAERRDVQAGSGYLAQAAPVAMFAAPAAGAKLLVQWPDGATTSHELPSGSGEAILRR